ncbi:Pkr1-domain-containing protein [Trichodelitschia bisporula]|uniref:Pkr1-domain-containing protein n=1 Tax=Trichodelitschia bisporula TaxID=703511 RepID=A0A6G1HUX2_9PEZI|nr:Pkr1-domain-containing protein [Trichodelitschia bisporula]
MTAFLTSLWTSIFTPGPTPTLLLATNASFAALQALLFALLVATRSAHFLALSLISGALWWSINWFAAELRKAEKEKEKPVVESLDTSAHLGGDEASPATTPTEPVFAPVRVRGGPGKILGVMQSARRAREESAAEQASGLDTGSAAAAGVTRRKGSGEGEAGTDSEWEKVEGSTSSSGKVE